jgi:hypothetical protein
MNARHTPNPPRQSVLPPAFRAVMESACARLREEIMRLEM